MYDQIQEAVTAAFAPKPDAAAEQAAAVSEAARTLANAKSGKAEVITFKAATADHGVIIGVAASPALDHQDEITTKGAVVTMAYDFCSSADRTFKANHGEALKADLVASWPGKPIYADDGVTIKGIDIADPDATHWFVGVRPHDTAVYEAAKAGEILGFSWGGMAVKTEG